MAFVLNGPTLYVTLCVEFHSPHSPCLKTQRIQTQKIEVGKDGAEEGQKGGLIFETLLYSL